MPAPHRPTLVIVSGAPGSGKSTLARLLAPRLQLPLLMKDELKEAIADAGEAPADVAASIQLGKLAYAVLFLAARRIMDAGGGVVIESNFRRGLSERDLAALVASADARLVHCTAAHPLIRDRYDRRSADGERHAAHFDRDRSAALDDDLRLGRFHPLELGAPTLVVETSAAYLPSLDEIMAFCERGS